MTKRASWERRLELSVTLSSLGPGSTEYYLCNFTLPFDRIDPQRHTPKQRNELVAVNFRAAIQNVDTVNVQYIGFVSGALGYTAEPSTPAIYLGSGQVPSIPSMAPTVDAVDYDPTSLPVSGIDLPIWQRKSLDTLSCDHYVTRDNNPQPLVAYALVQLLSNATTKACTLTMWYRYELERD